MDREVQVVLAGLAIVVFVVALVLFWKLILTWLLILAAAVFCLRYWTWLLVALGLGFFFDDDC